MRKKSALNIAMLLVSLLGVGAVYGLGEALLGFMTYLPFWLQCGIYLLFVIIICCLTMIIAESIHSGGYILKHKKEFGPTILKAMAIFLPAAFALGALTQLGYGVISLPSEAKPKFQGTMLVCDISDSMNENDPGIAADGEPEAKKGLLSYIDEVPLGEYLGVSLFNGDLVPIREYTLLEDEQEREELKDAIEEKFKYDGSTNTPEALIDAIKQIRGIGDPNWPGLIILFSDGQSNYGIPYDTLVPLSVGDIDNPKNRIPVNTIYYSRSPYGGYEMSTIAQKTGGEYYYMGMDQEDVSLRNVFRHSRNIFKIEKPNLIQPYYGVARTSPLRIALQIIFITMWGLLSGILVIIFLNNNKLFKHFLLPKIIISLVFAAAFAVIMMHPSSNAGVIARILLAVNMCAIYLPTYRWD